MPTEAFDTTEWIAAEQERQQSRISRLSKAFLLLEEARNKTASRSIQPTDVVSAATLYYEHPVDRIYIKGFLDEAIQASAIDRTEVGGRERTQYENGHLNGYLITAEQLGKVVFQDGTYYPVIGHPAEVL